VAPVAPLSTATASLMVRFQSYKNYSHKLTYQPADTLHIPSLITRTKIYAVVQKWLARRMKMFCCRNIHSGKLSTNYSYTDI